MADILRIPMAEDNPHFSQQVQLDGVMYSLEFHWNEREGAWYLDILDDEMTPLLMGKKMVPDWPLTFRSVNEDLPEGQLMLADTTGNGEYADLYGLDRRWVLLFFDAAALAELMA